MNMSIAVRMYKGRQQIYDEVQCINEADQDKVRDWFHGLCETTIGDDIDDVVRVKHSDVTTLDLERDTYNTEMITSYTLENGIRYVMLGYVKYYDEES